MPVLTKTDITALRNADQISIHLNSKTASVMLIKRKSYNAKPFETDQEYLLENCEIRLETTRGRDALASGAVRCFELVSLYHSQHTSASSIIKTLKAGDKIAFCFAPDHCTNGYVAEAGLHADALLLRINRNNKYLTFELETSIGPNNSARMCFGVPKDDSYHRMAADRRANA